MAYEDYPADYDKHVADKPEPPLNPTVVSSTALHQHQQEQEMLLRFTVPEPPVSTKQLSLAAETDDSVGDAHAELPRTLWMGDLDPWLDESAIVELWWQILAKKVSVKLIKPRSFKPDVAYMGLSHLGYCFVEFALYEDAQQALALNGKLLPDIAMPSQQHYPNNPDNQKKYFRLNWALGATLAAPIVQLPEYSLFVGDLSASTTEAHLLLFFQKSFPNSIKTVRVMTDPISGKSRCFGFVRFTDELERERALVEMNGAWFGGRPLRVALAAPRNGNVPRKSPDANPLGQGQPMPSQEYMFMSPPPPGAPGVPPSVHGYYPMNDKPNDMSMTMPFPMGVGVGGQPYLDPTNTTVFVGGLLSEVSEQTLYTLFKPFGVIQQIKIPPGKNCGFLKYNTREEAEEAILAMEGFIIGGNRVRLGWGRVSINNKKFHHRQQMAQVAQMQAAAAMSMGMDPAAAYAAAAGFPPPSAPMPGSQQGYPPMPVGMPPQMAPGVHGMPPFISPDMKSPDSEESKSEPQPNDYYGGQGDYYGYHPEGVGAPHADLAASFEKLSMDAASPVPPAMFMPYYPPPPTNYHYEEEKEKESEEKPEEKKAEK